MIHGTKITQYFYINYVESKNMTNYKIVIDEFFECVFLHQKWYNFIILVDLIWQKYCVHSFIKYEKNFS